MTEGFVVNASPVIALGTIDRLHLLEDLADQVVVPEVVAEEVHAIKDEASRKLSASSIRPVAVEADPAVSAWGLGVGETAVLTYAVRNQEYVAVVDDRAARRCASTLKVPTRGTVGLIVLGKLHGLIPSAERALRALEEAGFHISAELVSHAVTLAGESGKQ